MLRTGVGFRIRLMEKWSANTGIMRSSSAKLDDIHSASYTKQIFCCGCCALAIGQTGEGHSFRRLCIRGHSMSRKDKRLRKRKKITTRRLERQSSQRPTIESCRGSRSRRRIIRESWGKEVGKVCRSKELKWAGNWEGNEGRMTGRRGMDGDEGVEEGRDKSNREACCLNIAAFGT